METLALVPSKNLDHDPSSFVLFLSSVWQALPKPSPLRLGPSGHVALEIVGQPSGIHLQIGAPHATAKKIVLGQLAAHFPDVEVSERTDELPACVALASTELGLALDRSKGLRTLKSSDPDPQAGIVASLSGLSAGEFGLVQILARPALVSGFKSLTCEVIIRLAAGAPSEQQARSRLAHIIAALGQTAAENTLRPRGIALNSASARQAIVARRWPTIHLTPLVLTLEELAAIYHLPAPAKVHSPYLEVISARRLSPPREAPGNGVRVGLATERGRERTLRLEPLALLRHLAMFGGTGTGKTTLLTNMALDLADLGWGFTVIDPHRSLVPPLLERMPEARLEDVILVRFEDFNYPVGINFLETKPGYEFLTVDELVEIIRRIYGHEYWGPLLDMALRHAAYAAIETGGTLADMARILDDEQYRSAILPRIANVETRRFLQRLSSLREGAREQQAGSTLNRLQRFLGTPFIRNIVGQKRSTLNLRQGMDEGKILLVDLGGIGDSNAQLLGSLLTLRFRQAALSRGDTPEVKRRPHVLLMDECAWFITRTVGEMASEVRKFGLGLILAAQHLSQLKPEETRDAIFANVGSLVCFRMGERGDELYLERHFSTFGLTAEEIHALGKYEIYAQVTQDDAKLPAFWARTPKPLAAVRDERAVEQVLDRSRQLYARPRQLVEQEIAARGRFGTDDEPERRPRRRSAAD